MARVVRILSVAAVAAVAALVPACGKSGPAGRLKVAVVTNCTDPFWDIAEAGAAKAGKDFDVEVLFRQPATNTVPDQMEIVNSFQQQGVKGIAVSVINPKGQTQDLKRIGKEMPLLTMDTDAPDTGRLCFVGIDNYEAGKAVGRMVKQALPNGGSLAMFIGNMTSDNALNRTQGVLDELAGAKDAKGEAMNHPAKADLKVKKYGNFHLIDGAPRTDDTKTSDALNNAADVLARVGDLPGGLALVGLYAYNPPAILEAAKAKGMAGKVTIVGFDEDKETINGINAGTILGTVVQDPFAYGYRSVEILAAKARGDGSKVSNDAIPYRVVTKNGGPEETHNGLKIKNITANDLAAKLKADMASAGK